MLPLDSLLEFQGNLKSLSTENAEKLRHLILEYGFSAPIFIWQDPKKHNYILDGHQRLKVLSALQNEGYQVPELPVAFIYAADLKEAKKKLLHLVSQFGEIEKIGLDEFIRDAGINLDELLDEIRLPAGILDLKLLSSTSLTIGDDDIPEDVPEITKPGDIWKLGPHTLICGDFRDNQLVGPHLKESSSAMVFTDPPYNVGLKRRSGGKNGPVFMSEESSKKARNKSLEEYEDNLNPKELQELWNAIASAIDRVLVPGGRYFIFSGRIETLDAFRSALHTTPNLHCADLLIWKKNSPVLTRKEYMQSYEVLHYGWKKPRSITMKLGSDVDVWEIDKVHQTKMVHLTEKPVELPLRAIEHHACGGDLVVDFFLGSGTTLIAADKAGCLCTGTEKSPHYCDVIVERYRSWCEKNDRKAKIKRNGKAWDALRN